MFSLSLPRDVRGTAQEVEAGTERTSPDAHVPPQVYAAPEDAVLPVGNEADPLPPPALPARGSGLFDTLAPPPPCSGPTLRS